MIFFKSALLMLARIVGSFLMACVAAVTTFFAHGRISAAMEGVPLSELSEDYGGAFEAVLFSFFMFLIVFMLGLWATGKFIQKFSRR